MTQGKISEIEFYSKEMNERLELLVYLPASYSDLYKYSLLIVQDGKDYFQMGRLSRFADELLENGEIENVIIVGIPYKNVKDRREKYHPEGEKNQLYIRFLAHELLPWLEQKYPTSSIGKSRTLMGDSLAGTVSLMAALQYPHTFGKVIMHSPFVNDEVLAAVRSHQDPQLLDVYHVIGKDENKITFSPERVEDFLTPNRKLHKVFQERGFEFFYEEFDGGHSWKYWQPDVKRALSMMLPRN
ncbi:alpha/beta hydrolase [Siminovitchia sediminis]|uniref:Alpha/beta hydrolase n=1 Tax=Siminovitchia sediminis TaxID=1274353 RepID=A0ABW4KCX3_9BACI